MRVPWRDRRGQVSAPKSVVLGLSLYPAADMVFAWTTGGFGPLPVIGLVYWSGVWATTMLLATLAVTPLRYLLRWNGLVETRRILGVSALAYSALHTVAFFALLRWNWPAIAAQTFGRTSLLVALAAFIGLAVLGATSTDGAIRRLGAARWHQLHRLNYVATTLAVAHFLLSPGIFTLQYTMAGLLFWLLAWRVLRVRVGEAAFSWPALAGLAILACLFVTGLQVAWLWAYQAVPPSETWETLLSTDDEIAAVWVVLALGAAALATAGVAPVLRRRLRSG